MAAPRKRSLLVTLLTFGVLGFLGFVAGAIGGILWEEPRLFVAYLMGETTEIDWMGERPALPGVASPPVPPEVSELASSGPRGPSLDPLGEQSPGEPPEPSALRLAIQVGAFESSETAESLARDLRSGSFAAYVVPGVQGDHPRWRVRVGPFSDRVDAESQAARLKGKLRLPTWILEEGSGPGR